MANKVIAEERRLRPRARRGRYFERRQCTSGVHPTPPGENRSLVLRPTIGIDIVATPSSCCPDDSALFS
jgi:hypothetical protein